VPDTAHEQLIFHFENGQSFTMESCHRLFEEDGNLVATDHGIMSRSDLPGGLSPAKLAERRKLLPRELVRFKFLFDEIVRKNGLGESPKNDGD
jgi:hypothetical protein